MIRQWFILAVLFAAAAYVFLDFVENAVLYDPLSEIKAAETPVARKEAEKKFEHAWGAEIAEKNLFSPQRGFTPPPEVKQKTPEELAAAAAPPPPPPPVKPNFSLNGIIFDQFGEYVAYVQVDNKKAVPLREGDSLSGAKVVAVSERSVEMRWNDETIRLSLSRIKTVRGKN